MNDLKKLTDLVGIYKCHIDRDIILLKCKLEFEPHGLATETWEEVWYLELPQHQYHWENNKNELVRGKEGLTQTFKSRTSDMVIEKAIRWVEKYNKITQA